MVIPLLTTKFHIPQPRPELVHRPRLIEQVNSGIGSKLTLVSAPAGFGKSTLLSTWIQQTGPRDHVAWLSLDESDNDLIRFLTYVVAALNRSKGIETTIGDEALVMLKSQRPPIETVLTSLINEIAAVPGKIILILDDYHLIETHPIHDAVAFLLKHLPPQMHLVIATREDPNVALTLLRARGQLNELRAADLRFTFSEAAQFLNQVMDLNLSAEDIAALEGRTEGWITGLQLAAISMRGHQNTTSFIKSFTGSHHYVLDYLIEEVIEQQPESVQNFLLKTAILDRMTGSLCDSVRFAETATPDNAVGTPPAGQDNGQRTLEYLEHANLFIIPLDSERRWYRYHHLFADLLNQRLRQTSAGQISELHQRASKWYEQNDLPSDAIRHALAAENYERAADLAERVWPSMSGSFQSIEWLGWLEMLPEEVVRTRPVLCIGYAWAFLNSGRLEEAEARLLDAERCLRLTDDMDERSASSLPRMVVVDEEQFRTLPISLATARAYHAQAIGDVSGTVKYARRVLDLLPDGDHPWRGDATALLGLAYWANGDLEAAHRTLSDGLAGMKPLDVIVGTFVLAEMKMALGQHHEAISTCEHALRLAIEHGEPMPLGTEDVYTAMGELHRERGDLETAVQDLLTAKNLGEQVELPDWQYRWCIAQARLNESLGDLDGALDLLDKAERLYVRTPLPKVRPIAALKTRIWVKQGRLTEARSWVRKRSLSVHDKLSYLREFEHITLARVLIARYQRDLGDGSIEQAMGLLEQLLQAAEAGGRRGSVIEILVVQALAHEAQDYIPSALVSLERALTLAEPEGYLRIFVDEGPPIAHLLSEAVALGIVPGYAGKLLAVFEAEEQGCEEKKTLSSTQPLIEPLSERELEVLQLIALGLSNREIGERLFLALNTVKGHNRNIFGKLGVQRRTEAVARARELGLL